MEVAAERTHRAFGDPSAREPSWLLVVCSLEAWGPVQRRMQLLVREVLALDSTVHVLYVEPPTDVAFQLMKRRWTTAFPRPNRSAERLDIFRPVKLLPRIFGPFADRSLERQVRKTAMSAQPIGASGPPVLWINDAGHAHLVEQTGWPSIYDVTDDWLLASMTPRARARLHAADEMLVRRSDAVVVCSPDLARSRGATRDVTVIPNGVDVEKFTEPRERPADLPPAPVLLYAGSLHTDRFDVDLCVELAQRTSAQVVVVGPNSLTAEATARLQACPNLHLLGVRPYQDIPAYLQHADVLVVPHCVTPFTESLDPIKAYECLAVGRPTVATPVAGFRDLGPPIVVAGRNQFVEMALRLLEDGPGPVPRHEPLPTWSDRARTFVDLLDRVRATRRGSG